MNTNSAPRGESDPHLEEHADQWETLGSSDPLWGVYSTDSGRDGRWDIDAFMETGRDEAALLRWMVEDAGLRFGGRTLDFGSGVGRLSRAVAEHVDEVVGIDVAASMVEYARTTNADPKISYVVNRSRGLPFADGSFDLAVSLYVLQHIVPEMSLGYLRELGRMLRPGGVLIVQMLSEPEAMEEVPEGQRRASIEITSAPDVMAAGSIGTISASVKNVGGCSWLAGHNIKLANHWSRDGQMVIEDDGRSEIPVDIAPGSTVAFELRISAPKEPGAYEVELDMVQEFVGWWRDDGNATVRRRVDVRAEEAVPGPPPEASVGDSIVKMYSVPIDDVVDALEAAGCETVAVVRGGFYHPGWIGQTYVARRRQHGRLRERVKDAIRRRRR